MRDEYKDVYNITDRDIQFDKDRVNDLIKIGDYEQAADYLRQFDSNNGITKSKLQAKIYELDRYSARNNAIYAKLDGDEVADIKFANVILDPEGIKTLRYATDINSNPIYKTNEEFDKANPSAAAFRDWYKQLGSANVVYYDPNKKMDESFIATQLEVTIPYNKKSIIFNRDFLAEDKDDKDDILRYVEQKTGATEDALKNSGISFRSDDDNNLIIRYKKDNEYAKILTLAIANVSSNYKNPDNRPIIKGYNNNGDITNPHIFDNSGNVTNPYKFDDDGNHIGYHAYESIPYIYDNDGNEIGYFNYDARGTNPLSYLYTIYNKVSSAKTRAFANGDNNKDLYKDFSSTIFNISQIKTNEDKKRFIEQLKSIHYESENAPYGYINSADGDVLKEFDYETFDNFRKNMNGRGYDQIHIQGMVVNGKTGVLVTLDPKLDDDGNAKGSIMKMFIPNYAKEMLNFDINSSTDIQALMVYNDMKNYGADYKYKFDDGTKAYIDQVGHIRRVDKDRTTTIDDSSDAYQTLLRDLNRDFIIRQTKSYLPTLMNNNGKYDYNTVESNLQAIAFNAANELYPNIPLTTIAGNTITQNDVFNNKKFRNDMDDICNTFVSEKLNEIYELYNRLITSIPEGRFNK